MAAFAAPLVPGIGAYTGAIKPVPPVTAKPPPTVGSTGEALTLDALMARQKEIANRQGDVMGMPVTNIPQGLGQMAWSLVNALQGRAAEKELATGQQEISEAFGQMDPNTGMLSNEALQTIMRRDPDLGALMYREAMNARQHAATLEAAKAKEAAEAGPKATDVGALADDFTNTPDVKNFQNGQSMWLSMQDAAATDTAQADLNMIIAAAKLFDPTSVVRTEEGKAVELTGDAPSSIKGYFQYLIGTPGARLSKTTRQGLMNEAYSRINSYYKGVQQASTYYGEKARRWGYNPADVVRPFDAPQPFDPEKVVGSGGEEQPPPEEAAPDTNVDLPSPPEWYNPEAWPSPDEWKTLPPEERAKWIKLSQMPGLK